MKTNAEENILISQEVTGGWIKVNNELHNLYSKVKDKVILVLN